MPQEDSIASGEREEILVSSIYERGGRGGGVVSFPDLFGKMRSGDLPIQCLSGMQLIDHMHHAASKQEYLWLGDELVVVTFTFLRGDIGKSPDCYFPEKE